jgi:branched-chain amino acid transport system permease protein
MLAASTMLAMVIVGGTGSMLGPLVGALIMTALPQAVAFLDLDARWLGPVQGMIFTGIVMLFLLLRPQGLISAGKPRPVAK